MCLMYHGRGSCQQCMLPVVHQPDRSVRALPFQQLQLLDTHCILGNGRTHVLNLYRI